MRQIKKYKKEDTSSQHQIPFHEAGYSLMEILIALAIIALFAAVTGPQLLKYLSKAKSDTAQAQVTNLVSAVELYYLDVGQYPPKEAGLSALMTAPSGVQKWNGPYLKKKDGLTDPWGTPYQYTQPGKHGEFDIFSLGKDKAEGGTGENRDIVSW